MLSFFFAVSGYFVNIKGSDGMASDLYNAAVKAIREARFGMDARQPIVTAIEEVAKKDGYDRFDSVTITPDTSYTEQDMYLLTINLIGE